MNHAIIDDHFNLGQQPLSTGLLPSVLPSYQPTDKNAYKKDKTCTICGSPFSLLGSNQKYTCHFCFRGVCNRCSSQQIYEPIKHELLKICDNCYSEYIKTEITSKIQFEIMDVQAQIRFIQEKINKELQMFKIEHDCCSELKSKIIIEEGKANHDLRADQKRSDKVLANIGKLDDVIIKLESKVVELSLLCKAKEMKINQHKEEIQDLKSQLETENVNKGDLIEKIEACIGDNEKTEEKVGKAEEKTQEEAQTVISSNEVELTLKIDRLRSEIEEMDKNHKKIEKKIAELRSEGGIKIQAVTQLSQSILISKDGINPSLFCAKLENPYKIAKEQFKFNQQEIEQLKYELEEMRDTDKEEFNADEFSLPPVPIEQKKCIIQ